LSLLFQGHCWTDLPFSKGGRQGGVDTPGLWTRVLDLAITAARERWRNEGLGAAFPCSLDSSYIFDCLVWADDIIIVFESILNARQMFAILEEEIAKIGVTWKPSSLEMLRAGDRWNETFLQWKGVGTTHKIKVVSSILILGSLGGPNKFG